MKNSALLVLLIFLLVILLNGCITGSIVEEVKEDKFDYKVVFCSEESCFYEIITLINNSETADCALYNAGEEVIEALKNRKARVVVDGNSKINASFAKKRLYGLMHNKFCVLDGRTVLTGSFNPTKDRKSFDNIIIINSSYLAENYEAEFEEMWQGHFGGGEKTRRTRVVMNDTAVESIFCPDDSCAKKVRAELSKANKSVYFMSYSFTLKELADELLIKRDEGVEVTGLMENTVNSVYDYIEGRIAVKKHGKGLMHHKVFIIDNKTVITGSFNPTENGNKRNDENIIIIHNEEVAEKYLNEFNKLVS